MLVDVHRHVVWFVVRVVFAGFEDQYKVQEVDSFLVGVDRDPQSEAREICSYFLPGTVCLISRKDSEDSEPMVLVQPDTTILVLLGSCARANKPTSSHTSVPLKLPIITSKRLPLVLFLGVLPSLKRTRHGGMGRWSLRNLLSGGK